MLTTDRIAGGALSLLALVVLWESRSLPLGSWRNPGPGYMPVVLALVLLGLALAVVAMGGRAPAVTSIGWGEAGHALVIVAVCAFAAFALERLGYRLTMLVALVLLVRVVERRRVVESLAFSLALAFGSFYLFNTLLRVPLPRSPWGL